jgi:hypothetical protein
MANFGCDCSNQELAMVGRPNCVFNISATRRVAFMHARKSDGTKNYIDVSAGVSADFDSAFWNGLLTHSDPKQRLYLVADFENVEYPNTEATKEEASSGRSVETRPDFFGFQGEQWGKDANSVTSAEFEKLKCNDLIYFIIDRTGSIFGDASAWSDGKLYGIPVMSGSFSKARMLATDSTTNKISASWQNDFYKFKDGNLGGITSKLMEATLLDISPIQKVTGVTSSPTTSNVVVTIKGNFIEGAGFNAITGLVAGDFTLKDSSGDPVAIASVAEGADGVYTVTATLTAGTYTVGIAVTGLIMAPLTFTTA